MEFLSVITEAPGFSNADSIDKKDISFQVEPLQFYWLLTRRMLCNVHCSSYLVDKQDDLLESVHGGIENKSFS